MYEPPLRSRFPWFKCADVSLCRWPLVPLGASRFKNSSAARDNGWRGHTSAPSHPMRFRAFFDPHLRGMAIYSTSALTAGSLHQVRCAELALFGGGDGWNPAADTPSRFVASWWSSCSKIGWGSPP